MRPALSSHRLPCRSPSLSWSLANPKLPSRRPRSPLFSEARRAGSTLNAVTCRG